MSTLKKSPAAATARPSTSKVVVKKPAPATVKTVHAPKAIPKTIPKAEPKAVVVKDIKIDKVKKPKLMRDSFTIPKAEYMVMKALKERAGKLSRAAKKSEILRAGIKSLAAMSDAAFLSALTAVPTIKTGRPAATN